ncbi:hypothetical protein CSOJ01_13440 [Colletotrichum sojae]|uniref:Uncharacterized protein n=1 Tax=Colletotrichum sojae TaxID=2175907 RepID=A0A8H6ISB3_9PEZI|nr:hypothetical protein CSOJ01_13440 [Colletotrichum sojae]
MEHHGCLSFTDNYHGMPGQPQPAARCPRPRQSLLEVEFSLGDPAAPYWLVPGAISPLLRMEPRRVPAADHPPGTRSLSDKCLTGMSPRSTRADIGRHSVATERGLCERSTLSLCVVQLRLRPSRLKTPQTTVLFLIDTAGFN